MTTEQLVGRCIERDSKAWNEFIRRYESLVSRAVHYKINRMNSKSLRSEADDIVQEVFLKLWEDNKLASVRDATKIKGWLVICAINKTSNYCKRRTKDLRVTRSFQEYLTREGLTLEDIIPSREMDPARELEVKELGENIRKKIDHLREKEKRVLDLNLFGEEKHSRIAEIMDVPVNTVTSLIRRGKRKVKNSIRNIV